MNFRFILPLAAASAVLLLSEGCVVSKKKYEAMESAKNRCDSTLMKRIAQSNALENDTTQLATLLRRRNGDYGKLEENYNKLLNSSAKESASLNKNLQNVSRDLEAKQAEANRLAEDLKRREARVAELEKVLADKDKAVRDLKNKVSNALLNFKEKDLTVNVKNGKVYVSLSEQLLFKSGKWDVDPKGIEAIRKLAGVLKDNNDINVMVEGHTDDVPLVGSQSCLKDNWDLSVLRATAIVKELTGAGVSGTKLTAAGHGEFLPLAQGKTPDVRQKNRRTEIILTPKLDELFQILGN